MKHAAIVTALSLGVLLSGPTAAEPFSGGPSSLELAGEPVALDDDAKHKAVAEVIVLHATNDGEGIDPELQDIPQLKSPPFSSYDSYELLERGKLKLEPAADMKLPDGGKLGVTLDDVRKKGEAKRYVVEAEVSRKGGGKFASATFHAKEREYFFLAGQKYEKGILVIGIRLSPAS